MTKLIAKASGAEKSQPTAKRLPGLVWVTGWVSFFTDMSTELIYPVLPVLYSTMLHLNVAWMGLIEGVTETVVSLTKLLSGHWSDRTEDAPYVPRVAPDADTVCHCAHCAVRTPYMVLH